MNEISVLRCRCSYRNGVAAWPAAAKCCETTKPHVYMKQHRGLYIHSVSVQTGVRLVAHTCEPASGRVAVSRGNGRPRDMECNSASRTVVVHPRMSSDPREKFSGVRCGGCGFILKGIVIPLSVTSLIYIYIHIYAFTCFGHH